MTRLRRSVSVVLPTLALLLVAAPAWADPAGPTNYRAEVTGTEPTSDAIEAEVHGGDSYLVLTVEPGVEAVVPGYDGEELYLRVDADGAVYENQASATYFQNLDRYGAPVPPSAGADASPEWVQVGHDGSYAWHDHRIHWMSPTPPDQVDTAAREAQPVYDWEVPVLVDGGPVTITGSLTWYPAPSPVLPVVLFVVAAVATVVLAGRSTTRAAALATGAGVLVLGVVLASRAGLPNGVQVEPALLPPAIIAFAAPVVALLTSRRPEGERRGLTGLGALTAVLAVLLQGGALTRPVVPGPLPPSVVRLGLSLALGLAVGAMVAVVRGLVGPEAGPATQDGADRAV
ncbi:MAG: hypothetical protein KY461_06305 [Actinobacteria bacterium]|nr:hypothetical protein [Actinomycetota bacterium]